MIAPDGACDIDAQAQSYDKMSNGDEDKGESTFPFRALQKLVPQPCALNQKEYF